MKKKFFAKIDVLLYSVFIVLIESIILILIALFEIKRKEIAAIFIISVLLSWCIALSLGYKTISFETDRFVYKRNLFSRKYIVEYRALNKIYIDYTGCTVSYYKGAQPRIVLLFYNKMKIETNIRYGILLNLIANKPNRCSVKVVLNGLCSKKEEALLKDYLTTKQKDEIARLLAKKEARRKKKD